jgi:hypothetical protein
MRGGSDSALQSRELRSVLPLLAGQRFLGREAVAELDAAYRYLRVVENRLQQWNDEQTHQLPEDEVGRARLALAMGAGDWNALSAELYCAPTRRPALRANGIRTERCSPEQEKRAALVDMDAPPLDQLRDTVYYRRLTKPDGAGPMSCLGLTAAAGCATKSPETTLLRVLQDPEVSAAAPFISRC